MNDKSPPMELLSPSPELPPSPDLLSISKEEVNQPPTCSRSSPGLIPLLKSLRERRRQLEVSRGNTTTVRTSARLAPLPLETSKSRKRVRHSQLPRDIPLQATSIATALTSVLDSPKSYKKTHQTSSVTTIYNPMGPNPAPEISAEANGPSHFINQSLSTKLHATTQPSSVPHPSLTSPPASSALVQSIERDSPRPAKSTRLRHPPEGWIKRHKERLSQPCPQMAGSIYRRRIMSVDSPKKRAGKRMRPKQPLLLPKNKAQYFRTAPNDIYDDFENASKSRVYDKWDLVLQGCAKKAPIQSNHRLLRYDEYGLTTLSNGQAAYGYSHHTDKISKQKTGNGEPYADHSLSTNDVLEFDQQQKRHDDQYLAIVDSALKLEPDLVPQLPFNPHLRTRPRETTPSQYFIPSTTNNPRLDITRRPTGTSSSTSLILGKKERPSFL